MPKLFNLKSDLQIGARYGRLTIKSGNGGRPRSFVCICDCGVESTFICYQLSSGKTKSCGCLRVDTVRIARTTHGMAGTREYKAWAEAKQRCHNEKSKKYKWYGARGISVCDEWIDDFMEFFNHIGPCPDGLELDRIKNNKGYEPGNVHWVTHAQNSCNKRNSINVKYSGEVMTLQAYSDLKGIKYGTAWMRIKKGKNPLDFEVIDNGAE